MARVVVSRPGERVVSEITALVKRPVSPSVAQAPQIGLVQIGEIQPTELIPGPPGAQGPRGSRWYTGDGPPGSIPGTVTGDMYLDNLTDEIWAYSGTAWVDTGTNIHGSPDTGYEILAKLAPVDGAGSELDADLLDGQHGSYYSAWANLTGKPATFPPTLPIAWTDVSGKPATFPPAAHQHPFTDVTGTLTDAQHGNRAGGSLHALATAAAAGFMVDAPNDGVQYVRKNVAWAPVSVPPGTAMSDDPPASPLPGAFWFETDTGNLFLWFDDGTSQQWVQVNIAPPTSAMKVVQTIVTSSGTYNKPAGLKYLEIEAQGAGAGGSGTVATGAGQWIAGGAGGAGAWGLIGLDGKDVPASFSMTIGAAGTSGVGVTGTGGGATIAIGTAGGGFQGAFSAAVAVTANFSGGSGGSASGFDLNVSGASAMTSTVAITGSWGFVGAGGVSRYGWSRPATFAINYSGQAASGYGSGGNGALNSASRPADTGGAGSPGLIILREYF